MYAGQWDFFFLSALKIKHMIYMYFAKVKHLFNIRYSKYFSLFFTFQFACISAQYTDFDDIADSHINASCYFNETGHAKVCVSNEHVL